MEIKEIGDKLQISNILSSNDINEFENFLTNNEDIKSITISRAFIDNLTSLIPLNNLKELIIKFCINLHEVPLLNNLNELKIMNCDNLYNISMLNNLVHLFIYYSGIGELPPFPNLKILEIKYCPNIVTITQLDNIETIELTYNHNLFIIGKLNNNVNKIIINNCPNIETFECFNFDDSFYPGIISGNERSKVLDILSRNCIQQQIMQLPLGHNIPNIPPELYRGIGNYLYNKYEYGHSRRNKRKGRKRRSKHRKSKKKKY